MNDERRRCDRQPALFLIARELCCTGMTDGFCTPSNAEGCNCWIEAERFQRSTGLSANACVWVLKNRTRIEKEVARGVASTAKCPSIEGFVSGGHLETMLEFARKLRTVGVDTDGGKGDVS